MLSLCLLKLAIDLSFKSRTMKTFICMLLLIVNQPCFAQGYIADVPTLILYLRRENEKAISAPITQEDRILMIEGEGYLAGCIDAILAAQVTGVNVTASFPNEMRLEVLRQEVEFKLLQYLLRHPEVKNKDVAEVVGDALSELYPKAVRKSN